MGELPLVSVVIACYNHEKFVGKTLDSVFQDSYPNKEIIIVDDGSKDSSAEVIGKWIDLHGGDIKITFRSRPNVGLCRTLNELISLAAGKYLFPIASDDMFYGDTFTERVGVMEASPHKRVLLCDAVVVDNDDNITLESSMCGYYKANKELFLNDHGIVREILFNPSFAGPTAMIRRDIYDEFGPYPEDLLMEDQWFYQRAAAAHYMLFRDIKVACYRIHGANTILTTGKDFSFFISMVKSLRRTLPYFRGRDRCVALRRYIYLEYIYQKALFGRTRVGAGIKSLLGRG